MVGGVVGIGFGEWLCGMKLVTSGRLARGCNVVIADVCRT